MLGTFILLMSSCAPEYNFQIDVLKPAEISLPGNVKKIIVINHSYIPNYILITDVEGKTKTGFDSIFSFQHINAFVDYLKYSPRYEVVKEFSIAKSSTNKFKSLNLQTVDELCKKEGADAAVILEGCFATKELKVVPQNSTIGSNYPRNAKITDTIKYEKNDGEDSNNDRYHNKLVVESISYWQVYSAVTGKLVDSQSINDVSNIQMTGYDVQSLSYTSRNIWDVLAESSNRAGNEYAHRIAQQWVGEQRKLYNSSANGFSDAIKFAKNNNWEKAIEMWKANIKSQNPDVASKAAFNIAVACEVKDNLESAVNWAAKSYLIQKSSTTDNYIRLLEKRIIEQKHIKEQLSQINPKTEI